MAKTMIFYVVTFCARLHPGSLKLEYQNQEAAAKCADDFREQVDALTRSPMTFGPDIKGRILTIDVSGFMACLVETIRVETSLV